MFGFRVAAWLVGSVAISTAALAQVAKDPPVPPRTFDFTQALKGLDGQPVMQDGIALTYGSVVGNCLATEKGGGPALWGLAQRIVNAKDAVLSPQEIAAIEHCVETNNTAIVSGQIDPFLDPNYKMPEVR